MKLKVTDKTLHGLTEVGEFCFYNYKTDNISPEGFSPTEFAVVKEGCKFNKCTVQITRGQAVHPKWNWNGDLVAPTLSPSIGCDNRCGQHFHIINGEILP